MDTRRGRECGAVIRTVNAHLASGKGDVATDVSVETLAELPRLDGSHVGPQVIADTLGKHGVVVVENLASPELMDRVVMELDGKGVFYGAPGSFARNDTSRNAAKPLGESKAVQELAIHEKVVAAIQERLLPWCKKIVLGTCSAITVEPPPPGEEPADHQVLHRDDGMWAASGWPVGGTRPDLSVSVMWAVTDFTEGNGATRIVPGSHAMDREAEISEEMTRRAAMPKGSAMLWLGATAHGASAVTGSSHTEGQRKGLLFIYNQGWLKSEHNFHFTIPHDVQSRFSDKLRDLVGHSGDNAMEHEWYTGPVYTQPYLGGPAKKNAIELHQAGSVGTGKNSKTPAGKFKNTSLS